MKKQYYRLLTIAGSDSGGGAGIQADIKTFSALGCYGMSVVTALTAQNTRQVVDVFPVSPTFIACQIDAVMEDIGVDAVKVGMLYSSEIIHTVAERLTHYGIKKIVVDPVMVSTSGDKLLLDEAVQTLKATLVPIATVITPNLQDAAVLLEQSAKSMLHLDMDQLESACHQLTVLGSDAVLLKGGHAESENAVDLLAIKGEIRVRRFSTQRLFTTNTHGTGCTLSAAIAAFLARRCSIEAAVSKAKQYLFEALKAGATYQLGHGHGPVHHFHPFWE